MITFSGGGRSIRLQTALLRATGDLRSATERLSSGLRINRASDDAAGLAIASSLNADSRVYTTGIRNINDGLSALSMADSALEQLSSVSIRIRELAAQSANGSLTFSQRKAINAEASELTKEYNRLVATTAFNGRGLLNLSDARMTIQGGYGANGGISLSLGDELSRSVGTGSFNTRTSLTTANNPASTRIVDVEGDGDNDIVYALNSGGGFGVQLNDGTGNFAAQVSYVGTGGGAAGFAMADINGDGKLDALVNQVVTGDLWVATGRGDGTFNALTNTGVEIGGTRLDVGDFNNDGKIDVVGSGITGARLALGNGNGTFNASSVASTTQIRQIQIVDFNRDGHMDVVGSTATSSVEFLLGNGNGGFSLTTATLLDSAQGIAVDDFDGDGRYDLMVAYTNTSTHGQMQGYRQEADGSFTALQSFGSAVASRQMAMGDFNGDGIQDFVGTNTTNTSVMVLISNGDGTFANSTLTATGTTNHGAIGDLNGDGAADLLVRDAATNLSRFDGIRRDVTTLQRLDLYDAANARRTMDIMQQTIERVTMERAAIGAASSRLETAVSVLWTSRQNSEAASSQILDADVAEESAKAVKARILQNVAAAILGQSNQQTSIIRQLLRR